MFLILARDNANAPDKSWRSTSLRGLPASHSRAYLCNSQKLFGNRLSPSALGDTRMQPTRRLFGWLSRNRNDRLRSAKDNRSYSRFCWTPLPGTTQRVLDPNEESTEKRYVPEGELFGKDFFWCPFLWCAICVHICKSEFLQPRMISSVCVSMCVCVCLVFLVVLCIPSSSTLPSRMPQQARLC